MNDTSPSRQPHRRSARDWVVDSLMFLIALGFGLLGAVNLPGEPPPPPRPELFTVADQLVALAGCAVLWWRRRWPVRIAVALVLLSAVFPLVGGAMLVGLFSLCVHRPPVVSLPVVALSFLASYVNLTLHPSEHGGPFLLMFLLSAVFQGAVAGWGLSVQHRRQLFASLRERAVHAETEARLRAEQAQHQVRESIAREIHDVIAHDLSVIVVQAAAERRTLALIAYFVAAVELLSGLALIIGIYTDLAALLLTGVMVVALVYVKMATFKVGLGGHADIEGMYRLMLLFWGVAKEVFPHAWGLPPTKSRLMHSAGIEAMGYLMDRIVTRAYGFPDPADHVRVSLRRIVPHCRWTEGVWDRLGLEWNQVQNVTRHKRMLADFLIHADYEESRRP